MISIWKPGMTLLARAALAGCATSGAPGLKNRPGALEGIDETITEAVTSSAGVTDEIAAIDVSISGPDQSLPAVPPSVVLPADAIQPVTVHWNGPVEEFLQTIASRAGYSFSSKGTAPAVPALITISADEEPLFGVVRRAGAKVHAYAEIAFNPSARTIEIRYRK